MTTNTLLFDLDGTLLPFDQSIFMKGYFKALIPQIAHLVDKDRIVDQIMKSTMDMVTNEDPSMVNIDAFKESFFSSTGIREADIWPVFESFYETTFADLHQLTKPSPISREICRIAIDKGYQLVLATNPVFPDTAVRHRMGWAGISEIPFALVTTMETMHFCKPSPKYYVEIMDKVGAKPDECMMIGNDVQEDGVAGKLGMKTFLVNDYLIDRNQGHLEFTYSGSLEDVLTFVQALRPVSHVH